ncbi:NAD(P)-binding protein [Cryphonectria parasitica EP155]|uniref:NAD(P)-binding protein n=1 Tax=Cryphonectria parasitica (strain ATCC 38755 / EP155) TaxID=660469 RepID=A0A9P5CVQ4_CRYP1|nr:NAD(P)-binding protein [Cryphonectria parasitica EP155]KAF3770840.1 NAD(P)-binding protein [Cryphonectria parasitica EP155]
MTAIKASNILIFGATGFIGQYITDKVVSAQPAFDHITIFTSPETVEKKGALLDGWKKKAGNVTVVTGNVESESDVRAAYKEHKIDTVICAFGRAAIAKQIDLLRWADQEEVAWFLPSEFGTDIEYGPQSAGEPPHQQKLAVRRFIRDEVKKTQVTYVVTGPYFESWVGRMPGLAGVCPGFDVAAKEALLTDDGEGRVAFTTMPDVGKLVVAALQHPEAAVGKALKVNSFEVTPNQVLAVYEKLTGAKWTVSYIPVSKLVEAEKKLWAEQDPKATIITLRRIWAEGGTLYEKTDNEALGLKPEDMGNVEDVIKELLAAQQ